MKRIIAAAALLLSISAFAGGGVDGSGGDPKGSTEAQVREQMEILPYQTWRILEFMISHPEKLPIEFRAFVLNMHPKLWDDIGSAHVIKESGPCIDVDGLPKAAAGRIGDLRGDICFSLPEMRKIAAGDLKYQLIALSVHEHIHHFGGDEALAQSVQDFLLGEGRGFLAYDFFHAFKDTVRGVGSKLKDFMAIFMAGDHDDGAICLELGSLYGLTEGMHDLITVYSMTSTTDSYFGKNTFNLVAILHRLVFDARGFCRQATQKQKTVIGLHDREALKKHLFDVDATFQLLTKEVW